MPYTKIPNSNIAPTMGKVTGKAAGALSTTANTALNGVKAKVQDMVVNLTQTPTSAVTKAVVPLRTTVNTVSLSTGALKSNLATLNRLSSTLKAPVSALRKSIAVIKAIPAPQMWLPVSVTTVYSDLLETLAEKATQIEETCSSLSSISSFLEPVFKPVDVAVEQIKTMLDMVEVAKTIEDERVSEIDKKLLMNMGVFDNQGSNVFVSLLKGLSGLGSNLPQQGSFCFNYGASFVDLTDEYVKSRITVTPIGGDLQIEDTSGDYQYSVYIQSDTTPETPTGVKVEPPLGWSEIPNYPCWVSTADVSGKTGKVERWSEPEYVDGQEIFDFRQTGLQEPVSTTVKILGVDDLINLSAAGENNLAGVLKVRSGEDVDRMVQGFLEKVNDSSLSMDTKDLLRSLLDTFRLGTENNKTSENGNTTGVFYTGPDGTVYTLKVVVDPDSPTIAPRRYVAVFDPEGVSVLDGQKSFTDSDEILISEMKMRLGQLLA